MKQDLPKAQTKDDCLQREQLQSWFENVRKIENPTQSAYLQCLLLTGARRNELSGVRWDDVDFRWLSIVIRDKVEGERTIPLTPYVASLMLELRSLNNSPPNVLKLRRLQAKGEAWKPSQWVFSSVAAKDGRIKEPRIAHNKALTAAGLPNLSIHGLRRSFGTLCEWVEMPAGISAQVMGHAPSAIAEKHYRRRPLDLLRVWHTKIEGWILDQAGIEQPSIEPGKLKLAVNNA
jgi:integrase